MNFKKTAKAVHKKFHPLAQVDETRRDRLYVYFNQGVVTLRVTQCTDATFEEAAAYVVTLFNSTQLEELKERSVRHAHAERNIVTALSKNLGEIVLEVSVQKSTAQHMARLTAELINIYSEF